MFLHKDLRLLDASGTEIQEGSYSDELAIIDSGHRAAFSHQRYTTPTNILLNTFTFYLAD